MMQLFPGSVIDWEAAEPRNRQSCLEPRGVMPARLFCRAVQQALPVLPPAEGVAMAMGIGPSRDEIIWLKGRSSHPGKTAAGKTAAGKTVSSFTAKLVLLPVVVMVGCVSWMMLPGRGDAEIQPEPTSLPPAVASAQDTSLLKPAVTPTQTTLVTPVQEIVPPDAASADGLKISSQSWRRGGFGSNALVTFTLRNSNDYAVRDIEISCAFTRRDGSHLTDRTRTIHDTVNMRSRKTFARMHIGFVNVYADRAKCSPVTASRI
jgi:hypothetical protein